MKHLLTTALAFSITLTAAFANTNTDKQLPDTHHTTVAGLSLVSLAEENLTLKNQILLLLNANEEMSSTIAYNNTMSKMFAKIQEEKAEEQQEEMLAEKEYQHMMGNLFLKLKENEQAEAQAEKESSLAYNRMMSNMFQLLKTRTPQ